MDPSIGSPLAWGAFVAFVVALLALDLGVFHRRAHAVTLREAAVWSVVWVALAAAFAGFIHWRHGPERALEFTTGYVIEKALSIDNLFVFVVIFRALAIPAAQQHRVLFWGILSALVLRGLFVVAGGAFLARFHFATYVFGGLLVATGVKLLLQRHAAADPAQSPLLRLARRLLPVSPHFDGERFFTRVDGRRALTPLCLALVLVEATDVVFAVDSIPAIFAILGLRALYFLLHGVLDRFRYLKVGLAGVLIFVGAKMGAVHWFKVPVGVSLAVIGLLLGLSVLASLAIPAAPRRDAPR